MMLLKGPFLPAIVVFFQTTANAFQLLPHKCIRSSRLPWSEQAGRSAVEKDKAQCRARPRRPYLLALASLPRPDTEDDRRLLLTPPAVAAYLEAEVHAWLMEPILHPTDDDNEAAKTIASSASDAYKAAVDADVISHHGALISFISTELRNAPKLSQDAMATMRGANPYSVAKRTVDMLHHRLYQGTYTKTATPMGAGEEAARAAVGLPPKAEAMKSTGDEEAGADECLVEAPLDLQAEIADCLWRESDEAAWRERRFEKITMEGWRDPRRGNSGTSR